MTRHFTPAGVTPVEQKGRGGVQGSRFSDGLAMNSRVRVTA